MVVTIQQSHEVMAGVLGYNNNKVLAGTATILTTVNIPDPETGTGNEAVMHAAEKEFARYERRNISTEKPSFQMTINPNPGRPGEALSKKEAIAYAGKLMDGLGYKDQPYIIYQHDDIERRHYHVVSIRTKENGRKIRDSYEERRLQHLMKEHSKEYHYVIGNDAPKESVMVPANTEAVTIPVPGEPGRPYFDQKAKDIAMQYRLLAEEALKWHFESERQYQTILLSMGIEASLTEGNDGYRFIFQGLDKKGRPVRGRIGEKELGEEFYSRMKSRMEENLAAKPTAEQAKALKSQRYRLQKIIEYCAENAQTEGHFGRMLSKCGVGVYLSRNLDGEVFGATFTDMKNHRAYKASDISRTGILDVIKTKCDPDDGPWEIEKERLRAEWEDKRRVRREERRTQRRMDLAAAQVHRERPQKDADVPSRFQEYEERSNPVAADILNILTRLINAGMGRDGMGRKAEYDRLAESERKPRKARYNG